MGYWYTDEMSGERFYDSLRPKAEARQLRSLEPTSSGMAGAIERRLAELGAGGTSQRRPLGSPQIADPFGAPAPLSQLPKSLPTTQGGAGALAPSLSHGLPAIIRLILGLG